MRPGARLWRMSALLPLAACASKGAAIERDAPDGYSDPARGTASADVGAPLGSSIDAHAQDQAVPDRSAEAPEARPPASAPDGAAGSPCPRASAAPGFHVAVTGRPDGDGSAERPWNLTTALAHPAAVKPGATIYVHGGSYKGTFTSRLTGTAAAPITLRGAPGEIAVLDADGANLSTLEVTGSWVTLRDFEVTNSKTPPGSTNDPGGNNGLWLGNDPAAQVTGVKLVNLIIHDVGGQGVGLWVNARDSEVYGCLIYNNGRNSNKDHGIYSQNDSGTKRIVDNLIFNNQAYGLQIYGSERAALRNYHIEGNIFSFNGSLAEAAGGSNVIIGGAGPTENITFVRNVAYQRAPAHTNVTLGYGGAPRGLTARDNDVVGGAPVMRVSGWRGDVAFERNLLGGASTLLVFTPAPQTMGPFAWNENRYFAGGKDPPFVHGTTELDFAGWQKTTGFDAASAAAAGAPPARVIIRPNAYETGRATIAVLNPARAPTVDADLGGVLRSGDGYEVRNAQDIRAPAVLSGRYDGKPLRLPTTGLTVATPIGRDRPASTAPEFAVFIVARTACGP